VRLAALALISAVGALGTTTIGVTDSNWYFSPYTTYSDGAGTPAANNVRASSTYVLWNNPGGYFKTKFNGTQAVLNIVNGLPNDNTKMPAVKWSVDGGAWQSQQLTFGQTTILLASSLTNTSHSLYFVLMETECCAYDRWLGSSAFNVLKITGLTVDTGQTLSGYGIAAKNCIFYGDSITEAAWSLFPPSSGVGNSLGGDAETSYVRVVATALGCEYGQVAFGGQSWDSTLASNVPYFPQSWNLYYSGRSRLVSGKLSPSPDYLFVNIGTNGEAPTATAQAWLSAVRAALNTTTPVYVIVPFNQTGKVNLSAAVTGSGDAYVRLADLGAAVVGTYATTDGLHPSVAGHALLGSLLENVVTGGAGARVKGAIRGAGTIR
jgi:hypothetical protein